MNLYSIKGNTFSPIKQRYLLYCMENVAGDFSYCQVLFKTFGITYCIKENFAATFNSVYIFKGKDFVKAVFQEHASLEWCDSVSTTFTCHLVNILLFVYLTV